MTWEGIKFAFPITVSFINSRWNSAYCRGLLARCGLKACKPFERLAMRGQAYGCMEDTRILLTEYLLSSSTGSIFVEKVCCFSDALLVILDCGSSILFPISSGSSMELKPLEVVESSRF